MQRNILTVRVWALCCFLGFLSITGICSLWLFNEKLDAELTRLHQVRQRRDAALQLVTDGIRRHVNVTAVLGHSPDLRRYIMSCTQDLLKKTSKSGTPEFEHEIRRWQAMDPDNQNHLLISTSLEAVFLRDAIQASDSVFNDIIVTDAFGFVRIASRPPDILFCFNEEWWQRTLKLHPGQVYRYPGNQTDQIAQMYFCTPLFNDEGKDPVGVIRISLNPNRIVSLLNLDDEHSLPSVSLLMDQNRLIPVRQHDHNLTIGDIKQYSKRLQDADLIRNRSLAFAATSLSGRMPCILPDLDWTVIVYSPVPNIFSFHNPIFRRIIQIGLIAVILLAILAYQVALWISYPFSSFISGIRLIVNSPPGVISARPERSSIPDLAEIERKLLKIIEEMTTLATKSLRESTAALQAFSDMTQEAALEYDRRIIADSLLRISIRKLNADAGILRIHNEDYKTPMTLQYNLNDDQISRYESLSVHDSLSKQIYFSWDHLQHSEIWQDGFHVIISVPIRTRQTRFGTLYLLFQKAIDTDISKDHTLDLLAQQCAVYTSRSSLFHQLDRQISFTEGILSGIPWFICAIDSQMKITWHNNRQDPEFFSRLEDLVGKRCCSGFKGRETTCTDCPVKQTIQDGQAHESTQQWNNASGNTRWVRLSSFPMKDETGQMRAAILFIRDISHEIDTQSDIRRFARAIDCLGEAVILTGMDGRIVYTNKAFSRIFQYAQGEVLNHHCELLFPSEESNVFKKIMGTINHDRIWVREMDLLRRSDQRIPSSLTASLVLDEHRNPIGTVITCFDMSVKHQRERQIIRHYKELEIMQKITHVLNQNTSLKDTLSEILRLAAVFAGCRSGAVLLYEQVAGDETPGSDPDFDTSRPALFSELELPGYFANFVSEYRQGRESLLLQTLAASNDPTIFSNLKAEKTIESKLLLRMGFNALLAIPIISQESRIGLILLFSEHSFHFQPDNTEIYRSIASQVGMTLHARHLKEKLLKEECNIITGEIIARIGGDVRQILQGLEASRNLVDTAIKSQSWESVDRGWDKLNRLIWELYQVNLNILSYGSEDERLFFPEDLNSLVSRWLMQLRNLSFIDQIRLEFTGSPDMQEVYINKITIQRAFINLFTMVVDACGMLPDASIDIRTMEFPSGDNLYAIEMEFGVPVDASLKRERLFSEDEKLLFGRQHKHAPLLVSEALRCIRNHKGRVFTASDDHRTTIRIILPRFPIRSA